jgi:2-polyprenyl-3-methyl-5-hydroxy-6-metoxy-1,4-benzoquinol methylase
MSASAAHYQSVYEAGLDSEAEWLRLGAQAKARSIKLLTADLSRPFDSVCELGCGTGAVLEECMRLGLGLRYYGLDSSTAALAYLHRHHGDRVGIVHHDLEAGVPEDLVFDFLILSHVLEHLATPQLLLRSLVGRCRYLLAEVPLEKQPVPRAVAWLRSTLRARSREQNAAGHVQFFSRESFEDLIRAAGWTIVRQHLYVPYFKHSIVFSARRNKTPLWWALAPYYGSRLFGPWASSRLLNVHYAVLATERR